ncbi:hypothetical protein [Stenotrophomonas sp. C1657]|uniref:hypothetical protein n=1 Tax=Stenotrophomonas sp. C1657 TaxID=3077844 RepID=UPI00293C99E8|nr:hypothetical protein [Stenotrophomonas sp. C1657]MDV3514246.1 hypothetical protein [Stenotrophomonas sp. C1657]
MTLDATEISRVVKDGDLIAMAVLGGLAAAPLVKGLFALIATRRQRRKEFLEFWKADSLESSNLWLEEAIQHRYGASIPAELIRHVARLSWPSKRLRRLAMSAEFLQMDETGQAVTWSKKRRANAFWLEVEMVMSVVGYVALAALGVALIITGSRQGLGEGLTTLACGGILASLACAAFMHFISLIEARSSLVVINDAPRKGLWYRVKEKLSG